MQLAPWYKKFPWFSLLLFLLTYSVFGWFYSRWALWLVEEGKRYSWWVLEENIASVLIDTLGAILIVLMATAFTAPVVLITFGIGNLIKSDFKAFATLIIGSFVVVVIISWLEFFVRFLILISAAIFFRLDLQIAGYNRKQILIILSICSLISFGCGVLFHIFWLVAT